MKQYGYKTYYLKFETGISSEEQILEKLNEFGKEGWRLNRMYGEVSLRSLASLKGGVNFLLEKVTEEKI
ncbi:MAG: hypothetical protein GY869_29515 [Planctomycetes bacterium]|nr:hypothetical protein [Planctomycetota bacterium]